MLIKAVKPYIYPGQINFKHKPYEAWEKLGLPIAKAHYPWRWLHRLFFSYSLPRICTCKKEARLCFVQPWSLYFDTFPSYLSYEVIPFFWDVWPSTYPKVEAWLRRYHVKTAIFTASGTVEHMKQVFPDMNILWCPEGIDAENYPAGKDLKDRTIDFLHYGREIDSIVKYDFSNIRYVSGKRDGKAIFTQEELHNALSDARIVAAYPKNWTNPNEGGGIETLTQRYWECMLSGCVMIGHAPQELINLIGYNPVIELDKNQPQHQLEEVLEHIDRYQDLVDKNREIAMSVGDWKHSIGKVVSFLQNNRK